MRVIGFDLDMTLVDSADAIYDSVEFTCRTFGGVADEDVVRAGIGLPLDLVFADLLPQVPYAEALEVYRARYLTHGLAMQTLLPGAREALATVTDDGFAVVVVSAKKDTHVRAVLDEVGLSAYVPDIVGERFAETKAEALREHGAAAYVGDHTGDVRGAIGAGAVAVAVATGPTSVEDLRAAGADVVLADLTEFPAWWAGFTTA
ncbi:MAG TPA: HAD family hydrolase [Candidatus Nanopelagicales bacterium]|nr:HAD family hydrolase [Candidatus Nanopelagicales bacterium]